MTLDKRRVDETLWSIQTSDVYLCPYCGEDDGCIELATRYRWESSANGYRTLIRVYWCRECFEEWETMRKYDKLADACGSPHTTLSLREIGEEDE